MIQGIITNFQNCSNYMKNINLKKIVFDIKVFLFKLIFFNRNEYVTITIALSSKKKKSLMWYANNLFIPLVIIYFPYLLTLISRHFHTINFSKSLFELSITGALTLLGINVMRVSLSLINEKIDESKLPVHIVKNITEDIESIKSKLRLWTLFLTLVGGFFYLIQVGSFLDVKQPIIKWYILIFLSITFFSIFISRIIVVIQSNFVDNDDLIDIWMKLLNYNSEKEYSNLKSIATKEGL
jgi:hypothetical protein